MAIRVHYKPYVRWLWLGGLLMALGGLLTVFDKRYRSKSSSEVAHA
jgi:cytochrome c-type biogenesis protein CcmF